MKVPLCYLCHQPNSLANHKLPHTQLLCSKCHAELMWLGQGKNQGKNQDKGQHLCRRCGAERMAEAGPLVDSPYCPICRTTIQQMEAFPDYCITPNRAIAYYLDTFAQLLQWYKFCKELKLAPFFADLLAQSYAAEFTGFYIVPVPPRTAKLKQEAWDQVDYLCQLLHRRYRLPVLRLLRSNSTARQKTMDREQRLEQMYNSGKYSLDLSARRLVWQLYRRQGPIALLLLDDVYTTGATMDMCHRALKPLEQEAWISQVRSLSLCLVP